MPEQIPMDPAAVEAFRHLCELIHRPTQSRLARGSEFDWSEFEPVARALVGDNGHTSPESAGFALRALLREVVSRNRAAYPKVETRLSPLDVIELHLLEGYSWDAITTECLERGAAVSERTLRMRQREGLEVLLRSLRTTLAEWNGEKGSAESPSSVEEHTASAARRIFVASAVAVVVFALGAWFYARSQATGSGDLLVPLGQVISLGDGRLSLPDPYPSWTLPRIGSAYDRAIVVEPEPGEPRILLCARATGSDAGAVLLYDPRREKIVWRDQLVPRPEEIGEGEHLSPDAAREAFRVSTIAYGNRSLNLGASVVVVFVQRYSPCFAVEYDLHNGTRLGQYHHPGRLESELVADIEGDGQPEVFLGGQDNVLDRPVLVRLQPGSVRGGASTAPGMYGRGQEDACARVLLPAVEDLQSYWGAERLQVVNGVAHRWDPVHGVLSFDVGESNENIAYRVRLDSQLNPIGRAPISVGDRPALAWRNAGLDPEELDAWIGRIERVEGFGCGTAVGTE